MFQILSPVVLLGLTLCILPSHEAMAQKLSESGVVYEAARNKIGLIGYCRKNEQLDAGTADQAVKAVEAGLRKIPANDTFAREQGDLAQKAGEDGFWDTGRRRDMASVAKLFSTVPADLCQEWAVETLRAQARRGEIKLIAAVAPIRTLPQAEATAVKPVEVDKWLARAAVVRRAAPSAPPPPLPEKAPLLPTEAELASSYRTLPTSRRLASSRTAAVSWRLYSQSHPLWAKWPFNRLGKSEKCLMPGCRWPTPQERRSRQ